MGIAANHPHQRHQHQIGEHAAGAQNHRTTQADHIAQSENESDGVEADDDFGPFRQHAHGGHELEVEILLPHLESRHQKIVDA